MPNVRAMGRRWSTFAACMAACACVTLTVGVDAAGAAAPPSVYTGFATNLTTSSVTLNGTVYAAKQPTSYYFQYGTTSGYGALTPSTSTGEGTVSVRESAAITGLSPGTTYHYRLVAVNPSGTTDGQERTFTTQKIPLTFTFTATPSPDVFGSPFVVAGTLSGTGSANHPVQLQADAFPYLGSFVPIGSTELTSAEGAFSFLVPDLPSSAQLRVVAVENPPTNSRVVIERVAARIDLDLQRTGRPGFVRFVGAVAPAEGGAPVLVQLIGPRHRTVTVARTILRRESSTASSFSVVVHIRRAGLYRAYVRVLSGAQVANHSRTVLIR